MSWTIGGKPVALCPRCGQQPVRLRITGKFAGHLCKHRTLQMEYPDTSLTPGGWCDYYGDPDSMPDYLLRYPGVEPVKPARATGLCPICLREVRIRTSGYPDVVGTLWRHRLNDGRRGAWCLGGGELPLPADVPTRAFEPDESTTDNASLLTITGGYFHGEPTPDNRHEELATWWHGLAQAEIDMVVAKAIEYGATDLRDTGRDIYEMAGRPLPDDATATEVGIAFYVSGKLSRVMAAIREGRRPSLDTWLDIGIYARMAQRVHEHGAWPGV